MDTSAEAEPPDLALLLPRSTYYQLIHTLRPSLPAPLTGSAEDLAHRDNAAIAHIAAMLPANADEADLAAQCVSASAHARDCQRLAQEYRGGDHTFFLKLHARADSWLRQAHAARRLLQRVQAERREREADPAAADRAAWTEHCAIGLMADALGRAPPAAMAEPPPVPEPPVPEPAQAEAPKPDLLAKAELYAAMYPRRAALIRREGRVPDNCSFGPPDDDVVPVLV
ncbi:MAG TPA: hypothetical protein VKI44_41855, partial [Acetobacteraceae bacterium]|nr:hypothetical protein [Acetobacteraceae bacterium]